MSSLLTWGTYIVVFSALGILAVRDRAKAQQAVRVATKSFLGIFPSMLAIVGLIGLLLGLVPPQVIGSYLGEGAGGWATVTAALIGAVMFIPSIVAFPLAASLLRAGASVATIAAFLATLVMVGTVTLPLEIRHLGKKMALGRNLLSLLFALVIASVMGMVLR
jgi:uncharacterized membrane protein YraQ (UPF0718 family)